MTLLRETPTISQWQIFGIYVQTKKNMQILSVKQLLQIENSAETTRLIYGIVLQILLIRKRLEINGSWSVPRKADFGKSSEIENELFTFHQLPSDITKFQSNKERVDSIMLVQLRKLSAGLLKFISRLVLGRCERMKAFEGEKYIVEPCPGNPNETDVFVTFADPERPMELAYCGNHEPKKEKKRY